MNDVRYTYQNSEGKWFVRDGISPEMAYAKLAKYENNEENIPEDIDTGVDVIATLMGIDLYEN